MPHDIDHDRTFTALAKVPALAGLPPAVTASLGAAARLLVFSAGEEIRNDALEPGLLLLTAGSVHLAHQVLGWHEDVEAPHAFAFPLDSLSGGTSGVATQACEAVFLPLPPLLDACKAHPLVTLHFPFLAFLAKEEPLTHDHNAIPLDTPLKDLVRRSPVMVHGDQSICRAATLMQNEGVSAALLMDHDQLLGVVTDRDLRNRVVIKGVDTQQAVASIATPAPFTLDATHTVFDAQLLMAKQNIHHVPILDNGRVLGMVSASDLAMQQQTSTVRLAALIRKQHRVQDLVETSKMLRPLQQHLTAAGTSAYRTGQMITAITDALTTRLIEISQAQLGPAPVPFLWVAAGSQARAEQTAKSDQDNCLVLDDSYNPDVHGSYFESLSRQVCDGLAACGYIHCPGDMMAMTPKWRQPLHTWKTYFERWIDEPDPTALMLTCVFFDLRAIHGTTALLDDLRSKVLELARGNSLFLAHMVGNALKHRPPLNMFGNVVTERHDRIPRAIDVKHAGIVPIVDLARIYALSHGIAVVNTHDRLVLASKAGAISETGAKDLVDALGLLGALRIAQQARNMQAGQAVDHFLDLDALSSLQRSHLKQTFQVVQRMQEVLEQRYQTSRF